MLSCEEASRLVSESLDRRLPLRQRIAIRTHLLFCNACTEFRRQLLFIRDAVRRFQVDLEKTAFSSIPPLPPAVRERMKGALRAVAGDVATDEA